MAVTTEPRFSAPARLRLERAASTIGFAAFLASWVVAYTILAPADPVPARHVASLVRP
jgi:hypothetical protein